MRISRGDKICNSMTIINFLLKKITIVSITSVAFDSLPKENLESQYVRSKDIVVSPRQQGGRCNYSLNKSTFFFLITFADFAVGHG